MPPKELMKRARTDASTQPPKKAVTPYMDRFKQTDVMAFPPKKEVTAEDLLNGLDDESSEDLLDLFDGKPKPKKLPEQPKPRILEQAEKLAAFSGKLDHRFYATWNYGTVRVAGGVFKNKKKETLDRTDHGTLKNIAHCTVSELEMLSILTFDQLQKSFSRDSIQHVGATVTNVLIDLVNQRLTVAQAGDNCAWLYCVDEENNHWVERLANIHKPDEEKENKRILAAGGSIVNKDGEMTLPGRCRVTRSLGDISAEQHGLTHVPEVTVHSYAKIKKPTRILLILMTDGVLLSEFKSPDALLTILGKKENHDLSTQLLAKKILEATENLDDNAALVLADLPIGPMSLLQSQDKDTAGALSLTVCGGRGSAFVSDRVAKTIYEVQQELVDELMQQKGMQPPVEVSTSTNTATTSRQELVSQQEIAPPSREASPSPDDEVVSSSATIPMPPSLTSSEFERMCNPQPLSYGSMPTPSQEEKPLSIGY